MIKEFGLLRRQKFIWFLEIEYNYLAKDYDCITIRYMGENYNHVTS